MGVCVCVWYMCASVLHMSVHLKYLHVGVHMCCIRMVEIQCVWRSRDTCKREHVEFFK